MRSPGSPHVYETGKLCVDVLVHVRCDGWGTSHGVMMVCWCRIHTRTWILCVITTQHNLRQTFVQFGGVCQRQCTMLGVECKGLWTKLPKLEWNCCGIVSECLCARADWKSRDRRAQNVIGCHLMNGVVYILAVLAPHTASRAQPNKWQNIHHLTYQSERIMCPNSPKRIQIETHFAVKWHDTRGESMLTFLLGLGEKQSNETNCQFISSEECDDYTV